MKQAFVKGTNIRIIGTLEIITGCSIVDGFDENEQPIPSGTTDIWWNSQRTETDPMNDRPIYVDEDNNTRDANEVEFRDE